jgi:hypothetical protein
MAGGGLKNAMKATGYSTLMGAAVGAAIRAQTLVRPGNKTDGNFDKTS